VIDAAIELRITPAEAREIEFNDLRILEHRLLERSRLEEKRKDLRALGICVAVMQPDRFEPATFFPAFYADDDEDHEQTDEEMEMMVAACAAQFANQKD
jgi:hypothetical protein